MPGTDFDEVFDGQGNKLSSTPRVVSDTEMERRAAPPRLKQSIAGLRTWQAEAQANFDDWPTKTNAQKDAANRELQRRFGVLCDRLKDLLLHQALD
jgi:hypothetical protein